MMTLDKNKKILIVGLGLIGGSYAAALSRAGYTVGGIDCSAQTVEYALSNGMITSGSVQVTADYVGQFDIVVFALYPHIMLEWTEEYGAYMKEGALVTDVTGVKSAVVYRMQELLGDDAEFVGAHPMAGREVGGIQNASAELFCGANYIVTPTERNTEEKILVCEAIGHAIGSGKISRLAPEKHDEMIGFLSQLTHAIAVALMTSKDSSHLLDYTGDSFRDLTRIAKINENMWTELFLLNKQELLAQMDLFLGRFGELRSALLREDKESLKQMMRLSTKSRELFDEKK
jgi:prephenate dehydrogenase